MLNYHCRETMAKFSATVPCCCYYAQRLFTKCKFATTVGAARTFYMFSQISWTCLLIVTSKIESKQLKIVHILRQTFPQAYESCREKTNHGTMRYLLPPLICPLTGHFFLVEMTATDLE